MFKYYNCNLITSNRSYTVEEICRLYKDKKLHPQTVRDWVNNSNLKAISLRPVLIYGGELKEFVKNRNDNHKKTINFNQFKCLGCKGIIIPLNNEIFVYRNKNHSIKAIATCPCCGKEASRFYKKNDGEKLQETFIVKNPKMLSLYNTSCSTSNTNLDNINKTTQNESSLPKETITKTDYKTNLNNTTQSIQNSKDKISSKTNLDSKQTSLFDFL